MKRWILMLLLAGLLFGGVFGWKMLQWQAMAEMGSQPPPPAVIAAERPQRLQWTARLEAVGSLSAAQGVMVANEVPGTVAEILFEPGQAVAAGTPLLRLDDAVDRAEYEGLRAAARLARLQLERTRRLFRDKSVSQADLDTAQATWEAAEAAAQAKRAALEKKTLRAPFAGVVGIRRVDPGAYLAPGTPVVSLQARDPLQVDFSVPEADMSRVFVGQRVELRVQAFPDQVSTGTVTALDSRIEPGSRNLRVRARIPNPDDRLAPGMFAEVALLAREPRAVLTLPRHAISYAPYGDSVFVVETVEGQQRVQRRRVETGEARDGRIEIRAGLADTDLVVTAGHNKLRNGQAVTVDNSMTLAPPAS